jgi:hypothetical protein
MIVFANYAEATNQPLNHARILWDFAPGMASGGIGAPLAANDFTAQRWTGTQWTYEFDANQLVDTFFIAAHNLAGKQVTISVSVDTTSGFAPVAVFTPADNSPVFVMANRNTGEPFDIRRYRLDIPSGAVIGIIRAGQALQMQQPLYGGHRVALFNRVSEGQQSFSETGQWLGRTLKRLAYSTSYTWEHIPVTWYRDNFEPFAKTLPLKPFAIAGNPAKMPQDVAWAWVNNDVSPENMGVRNFVTMSLEVVGYGG